MAQIVRKKKGRSPKPHETPAVERHLRRSLRRRNVKYFFDLDDYLDDDELFESDEDQRRRHKMLELLLRPESGKELESATTHSSRSRLVDHLPSAPTSSFENPGKPSKKPKINDEIDDENDKVNAGDSNNDENDKVSDKSQEAIAQDPASVTTPTEAPSGLPLPDKKALELVLDKLQKKDYYGVYAEPVDPEELPDYHDMIKHPMDFATVRSKLRNGLYATLEQFEHDVFLICSNAMQYNPPNTIYHKQARSIKELATKEFHKIRLNAECSENDVKPDQKMRCSSTWNKQIKNPVSWMVQESPSSDFSSGATLATAFDIHNATYFRQPGCVRPGNTDVLVEGYSFLLDNGEESLPGKGSLSRFGRNSFVHYETRRATYRPSLVDPVTGLDTMFSSFERESKQLVPVGLYSDHSYARSLARFAATLGSVAWKVASKRIEQALPQGYKFGRGWVGEYEPLPTPSEILYRCTSKEPPFSSEPDKKILKQFELKNPPLFRGNAAEPITYRQISEISEIEASRSTESISRNMNFSPYETSKLIDSTGVGVGELPNGKIVGDRLYSNTIANSSSDLGKAASRYPRDQRQGLSDQVQSMRMLAEEARIQSTSSNQSWAPSSSGNNSNITSVAAAGAWISAGAGGFKTAGEKTNLLKNHIHSHSLSNSTRDNNGERTAFGGMHVQPERISSPFHAFSPLGFGVGNEIQCHNQTIVHPHLAAADLARLQLQSNWRNLINPQMHSWQKQESFSPDSNISFQSSQSAGMLSPGILVDSQLHDLALQL